MAQQGDFTPQEWTLALRGLAEGRADVPETVLPHLVRELRAIARAYAGRHGGHEVEASVLVNEAYVKLFGRGGLELKDRSHFFALAARAMRQVLVDQLRKAGAQGAREQVSHITWNEPAESRAGGRAAILDLHEALEELAQVDERQATLVELRYFGGLEVAEVAEVLGCSKSTVEREWRFARSWLARRLQRSES